MNWKEASKELEERRGKAVLGGGALKIEKQHQQGKLTARERIEILLDPGTFVEVDGFVEGRIDDFDLDKRRALGDGVVTGYGEIDGRTVFVASEDKKRFIRDNFDAYACEMEGAAIGHACYVNGIPFGVLRTISDGGDDMDFMTFSGIAAEKGKEIVLKFLNEYKEE